MSSRARRKSQPSTTLRSEDSEVLVVILLLVIGGGIGFLLTWDIPPPAGQIEKILPNDRFEK